MPYVTSVERNAEQRGREEGREEESAALLLRILTGACGTLPASIQQKIRQLSLEQRQVLGEALLKFDSMTDLESWLNNNPLE